MEKGNPPTFYPKSLVGKALAQGTEKPGFRLPIQKGFELVPSHQGSLPIQLEPRNHSQLGHCTLHLMFIKSNR